MPEPKLINRVRELRGECGMTQGTLADRVGVSRQSINYIEQGTYAPSVTLALRIAAELGVRIEDIFTLGEE
ncbi:MAG: helix-turn-helix transcriptional regulator [Candidatus Kapaibacterium sp.]